MKIHPTAIVHPSAKIGDGVEIGPFSVIEENVVIGDNCKLEGGVVVKNDTIIGDNNYIAEWVVLGGLPQHLDIPEVPGTVLIGSGNTIREHTTVHRALKEGTITTIGDNNLIMVNCHIAHDCRLGDNVIIANNTMLAGHVTIGDRAVLSGAVAVHQFTRIGTLAMVGGQAHVTQDIPPFCLLDGLTSLVVGLNRIGLRRAGYTSDEVMVLKKAYRLIYRSNLKWTEMLARMKKEFSEAPASVMLQFLETTTRGILGERQSKADFNANIDNRMEQRDDEPQVEKDIRSDEDDSPPTLKVRFG